MNALNKTLICNPQIEWSELLSGTSPLSLSASLPVWMCAFDREKMPEVGRKKKDKKRKKEKKHTKSIARIRARTSPPAVSFTSLKFHYAAKETKYKILCHDHAVSKANKGKKSEVNPSIIFCKKKLKRNWSWPSMADFRDIESMLLPCNPTNNGKKNLCDCAKELIDRENWSRSPFSS